MKYVQSTIVDTAHSFNKTVLLRKIVIEESINALTYYASHNLINKAFYEID